GRRDGWQRRSAPLEPCAHRHQVSRGDAPALRRPRRASRMREAVGRDGARTLAGAQPPHRRPGRFGSHAQGQRPGRDRAHRRHHLAFHRQPRRAQDAARAHRPLDRPPPRDLPCRLDASAPGFETEFSAFLGRNRDSDENVGRVVAEIVADVRARGDAALVEYTRKFDRLDTDAAGLRIADAERKAAAQRVPAAQREALLFAAQRIEAFHRALLPKDVDFTDATGTRLGARYRPLDSVGVYVPGGTAAYPSSVLMNIVPAKVAGVSRIVMVV